MPKPPLVAILHAAGTLPEPPRPLKDDGRRLWNRVHREFVLEDAQGLHLLQLACEQLDCVAAMQAQIDAEGLTIRTRSGVFRDHPLLKHALAGRAFVAKVLSKLGIDPPRPGPGRPPGRGA
jgi:P27 family predicted phage terminase small subunit